jgi:fructose/tagatose bisphosphate aldolase
MVPESIIQTIKPALVLHQTHVVILDPESLQNEVIDSLIKLAVFGTTQEKTAARWIIWETAQAQGIYSTSIHPLYIARGRQVTSIDWTVPAMNFRGLTYDISQSLFQAARKTNTAAFISELARGEMIYTNQDPGEYVAAILAGAIKVGYSGPVFIQGDHFQTKSSTPGKPDAGEISALSQLITAALNAGFYNIDIDTSTLVDLAAKDITSQQSANIQFTAELLQLIRTLEPAGITVSVGGEIGHIGGKNSTPEEFAIYMDGLANLLPDVPLISKISIATGTEHGGVVNPDGSLADVSVDFDLITKTSQLARSQYNIAGAVQHGASTLPDEFLSKFPEAEAAEIHLATGFQNMIFDHPQFPKELIQSMYRWLDETATAEKKPDMTNEQFHYKLRKKCWGQFKEELWNLSTDFHHQLIHDFQERFEYIFHQLNVIDSQTMVADHIPNQEIHKEMVDFAPTSLTTQADGLSD